MDNHILFYASRFKTYYGMMFRESGKKFHLSQLEMDIMLFLKNNPRFNTARDLCAKRGIAKSNASTGIRSLEEKKILKITVDEESRKVHRLMLTDSGEEIVSKLQDIQKQCFETMLKGFSKTEIDQMKSFLDRFDNNIDNALKEME